eukprot:GFUD01132524.1.p1 GENE.GFUD01132524.1~~GFUD01132524.1.p1  ORF type:complete len:449 (+),score=148.41 GFUD01132524.1:71-1417(+)
MAEKFCNKFGPGAHQLKIGKSFEKKGGNSVYHSIRYDFKPVSVDEDRMGKLEVQENKSVSVTLPHIDGHGATNYKGNAKPANTKDCILVIDHETGELTLERISNQIMLKKTRAEKAEKQSNFLDKVYPTTANDGKDISNGLVLPSNPYQVKAEPHKPSRKEPENPYEVKKEPDNPYEPKKEPVNPYEVKPNNPYEVKKQPRVSNSSNTRPQTPQSLSRIKKNSPSAPYSSSSGSLPGLFKESLEAEHSNHSNHTISPLHSNKSSPARPSPNTAQGYNIDSLGRVISESSDDSDSASSSGSDSDSDSEPAPDKDCVLAAAMAAAEAAAPPSFSLPVDLGDLLLPSTTPSLPPGPGHLPTARPQKPHKSERHKEKDPHSSKQKTKPPPAAPPAARPPAPPPAARPPAPPPAARPPPPPPQDRQEEEGGGGGSMPSFFGDLGDDLQLSDSD